MIKTVFPAKIQGSIAVQPSKSFLHRAVICAALANGKSRIRNIIMSEDINATLRCAETLGLCSYERLENEIVIFGGNTAHRALLDCGESGTTYRFFVPIASSVAGGSSFTGRGRLMERPLEPLKSLMQKKGVEFHGTEVCGKLSPGRYEIAGNVSSQFISGLMLALNCLDGNSEICVVPPFESRNYVLITQQVMNSFGADIKIDGNSIYICGRGYSAADYIVEADWSHAAFFAVAGIVSGKVTLENMNTNSLQGDAGIADILLRMGAGICGNTFEKSKLHGIEIDASQIPDIVPILAVCACAAEGETRIFGAERLRIKESDRLKTTEEMLKALGADIHQTPDGLVIRGSRLKGGRVSAAGDHRIAMSAAIAASICEKEVIIEGAECVAKSAPDFFEQLALLGGEII